MNIELGNGLTLKSDALNVWIEKRHKPKKVSARGKAREFCTENVSGFHGNLRDALASFADFGLNKSDAVTLAELKADADNIRLCIAGSVAALEKKFGEVRRDGK
jgi:hypothetical protein